MICKVCGIEVESGDVCPACGASLVEETVEETVEVLNIDEAPADVPAVDPGAQKGKTALILGIVSLVLNFACCIPGLSLIAGIVALVFAISASKMSKAAGFDNKNAKIGMILAIIALVLGVIVPILSFVLGIAGGMMTALTESNNVSSSYSGGYYY